ncbi:antibiotic ABC transporter permease, partial [Pseudomonas aeruginosa]|nr:antibiotic ABC transporter permease [Pseudomonas aeruginosa]
ILKDPAIRVILIVPIVIQSLVFGYAATYDLNHVRYAVLNESRGAASTNLLARLEGSKVFVRAATLRNSSDIARAIDNGEALLVLHFAPDFDA